MPKNQWTPADMPSMQGRTILITGANSGIGYQAALELARKGARVLMGVRSVSKGQAAEERLRAEVPSAQVDVVELDMASLASVRAAADKLLATGQPLDVLINNAGVMALPTRELTADGMERQMETNHFGHFALTGLLMPALLAADAPRVVTVSSLAHRGGVIDPQNLQSEKHYKPWDAYNTSKLANLLFAKELDRRVKAAGGRLISVAVHPGVSQTSIVANGPGGTDLKTNVLFKFFKFLTQSDAAGAWPTEFAATMPGVRGGAYYGPDGFQGFSGHPTEVKPKPRGEDMQAAAVLWQASERATGVVYPPLA